MPRWATNVHRVPPRIVLVVQACQVWTQHRADQGHEMVGDAGEVTGADVTTKKKNKSSDYNMRSQDYRRGRKTSRVEDTNVSTCEESSRSSSRSSITGHSSRRSVSPGGSEVRSE